MAMSVPGAKGWLASPWRLGYRRACARGAHGPARRAGGRRRGAAVRSSPPRLPSRRGGIATGADASPGRRWLDPDPAARSGAATAGQLKAHAARWARSRGRPRPRHVGTRRPGPGRDDPPRALALHRPPHKGPRAARLRPHLSSPPPHPSSRLSSSSPLLPRPHPPHPARPPPAAAVRLRSARATAEQRRASVLPLWSTRPQPAGRPG